MRFPWYWQRSYGLLGYNLTYFNRNIGSGCSIIGCLFGLEKDQVNGGWNRLYDEEI
jgi:hypothetical protein